MSRFASYKRRQKRRKNAEVANGVVSYNTELEIQEAIVEAFRACRYRIEHCDSCKKRHIRASAFCEHCQVRFWNEDGDYITDFSAALKGAIEDGTFQAWIVEELKKAGVELL